MILTEMKAIFPTKFLYLKEKGEKQFAQVVKKAVKKVLSVAVVAVGD